MNLELYEKLEETASKYSFEKINNTLNELELLEKDKPVCFLNLI